MEMLHIVLVINEEGSIVSVFPAKLIFQVISPKVRLVGPISIPFTASVGVPHFEEAESVSFVI